MLPEVEEYVKAREAANKESEKARDEAANKYGRWSDAYYIATNDADNKYYDNLAKAKAQLKKNAKHSLVHWMVNNDNIYAHYWSFAERILERLPATDEELHRFAKQDANWCEVWDRFRAQALEAGAMDGYVTLEYQQNNKDWAEFKRSIRMTDGELLKREDIMKWFRRGAKSFEFQIRRSTYRFRLISNEPIK